MRGRQDTDHDLLVELALEVAAEPMQHRVSHCCEAQLCISEIFSEILSCNTNMVDLVLSMILSLLGWLKVNKDCGGASSKRFWKWTT